MTGGGFSSWLIVNIIVNRKLGLCCSISVIFAVVFVVVTVPESGRPLPLLIMNPNIRLFGRLTSNRKVPSEQTWRTRPTERTEQGRPTSSRLRQRCKSLRHRHRERDGERRDRNTASEDRSLDGFHFCLQTIGWSWVVLENRKLKSETGVLLFSSWSVVRWTILLPLLVWPKILNWWRLSQLQEGRPLLDKNRKHTGQRWRGGGEWWFLLDSSDIITDDLLTPLSDWTDRVFFSRLEDVLGQEGVGSWAEGRSRELKRSRLPLRALLSVTVEKRRRRERREDSSLLMKLEETNDL